MPADDRALYVKFMAIFDSPVIPAVESLDNAVRPLILPGVRESNYPPFDSSTALDSGQRSRAA
jgi:hypothetical protein